MLQSLRQVKRRIRSIENTKKITQAMEMVSGAKLKRSESGLHATKPYFTALDSILKDLLGGENKVVHPLLEKRMKVERIALCVITSDTGLCSTYNDNVIRLAEDLIRQYGKEKVKLVTVGKKAFAHFKKCGFPVIHSYLGLGGWFSDEVSGEITKVLMHLFLDNSCDEVYVAYTRFMSVLRCKPTTEKFLNIECNVKNAQDYILEPNLDKILDQLLSRYIFSRMKFILLNSFTSEHSARMIAMKAATDNSQELIDNLTLLRNKARQSLITKEIIEVASAAEALKG